MSKKNVKGPTVSKLKPKLIAEAVSSTTGQEPVSTIDVPTRYWEEMEDVYNAAGHGLLDIANAVNSALEYIRGTDQSMVGKELVVAVRGLKRDIENFANDLVIIHNAHKNKIGEIKGDEDIALSMRISIDYSEFMEGFRAVTMSPFAVLTEELVKIEEKRKRLAEETGDGQQTQKEEA